MIDGCTLPFLWMVEHVNAKVQRVLRWFYHLVRVAFILKVMVLNLLCSFALNEEKRIRIEVISREWEWMKNRSGKHQRKRYQTLHKLYDQHSHISWFMYNKYTKMAHKSQTTTKKTPTYSHCDTSKMMCNGCGNYDLFSSQFVANTGAQTKMIEKHTLVVD